MTPSSQAGIVIITEDRSSKWKHNRVMGHCCDTLNSAVKVNSLALDNSECRPCQYDPLFWALSFSLCQINYCGFSKAEWSKKKKEKKEKVLHKGSWNDWLVWSLMHPVSEVTPQSYSKHVGVCEHVEGQAAVHTLRIWRMHHYKPCVYVCM